MRAYEVDVEFGSVSAVSVDFNLHSYHASNRVRVECNCGYIYIPVWRATEDPEVNQVVASWLLVSSSLGSVALGASITDLTGNYAAGYIIAVPYFLFMVYLLKHTDREAWDT